MYNISFQNIIWYYSEEKRQINQLAEGGVHLTQN